MFFTQWNSGPFKNPFEIINLHTTLNFKFIFVLIKRYIDDFNKIPVYNEKNASEVVANPFTAFHILKRTVVDWELVADSIRNHTQAAGI